MCGIAGIFGKSWQFVQLEAMHAAQVHRGFDDSGFYSDSQGVAGLAHNRLSIIDLSPAGYQPLKSADGRFQIVFNGEIYNYLELRRELESEFDFQTATDTEVLLAAYQKYGAACLERLTGMFAFIVWDEREKTAFAARDRFGVKPLYFHDKNGETLFLASEIKAFYQAGIKHEPNEKIWAAYLAQGFIDHTRETFAKDIFKIPAGHFLTWKDGRANIKKWYDSAETEDTEFDSRPDAEVSEEYLELLKESVRLRFRADVPVGINLSGGVDSSTLLGLIHALEKDESTITAYTFATDDERYDELPWVRRMLEKTRHPLVVSTLKVEEVPALAESVQEFQDEPFGGIPTLAYAKLFDRARKNGTIVLLDGNGLDEQWAGYDYYAVSENGNSPQIVQGTKEKSVRPECLKPEFYAQAETPAFFRPFPDNLRNLQYRDFYYTKIPRAMRYNDRISMRSSTELREPFLDHKLVEFAFRQPANRKISGGIHKKMLREIVKRILPASIAQAPKRALQTPQREWLRGELADWADDLIKAGLKGFGSGRLDEKSVLKEWEKYRGGLSDNSFYVWQWITVGLESRKKRHTEKNIESYGNKGLLSRQKLQNRGAAVGL